MKVSEELFSSVREAFWIAFNALLKSSINPMPPKDRVIQEPPFVDINEIRPQQSLKWQSSQIISPHRRRTDSFDVAPAYLPGHC